MAAGLVYETLGRNLVDAVPEVADRYRELLHAWGEDRPGPHIVYGDVLNPYLMRWLTSSSKGDGVDQVLRRIFALLEKMARDTDPNVRDVVATTVVERLGDEPAILNAAYRYMGEATRQISDEVEAFWSGSDQNAPRQTRAVVAGS